MAERRSEAVIERAVIEAIRERLSKMPNGDYHMVVGSGDTMMTAIACDVSVDEEMVKSVFVADVLPDYMVDTSDAWDTRTDRLDFIANAPSDIAYLLGIVDALIAGSGTGGG